LLVKFSLDTSEVTASFGNYSTFSKCFSNHIFLKSILASDVAHVWILLLLVSHVTYRFFTELWPTGFQPSSLIRLRNNKKRLHRFLCLSTA